MHPNNSPGWWSLRPSDHQAVELVRGSVDVYDAEAVEVKLFLAIPGMPPGAFSAVCVQTLPIKGPPGLVEIVADELFELSKRYKAIRCFPEGGDNDRSA